MAVYRHGDRTPGWLSEGRQHHGWSVNAGGRHGGEEVQYAVENNRE